MTERGAGRGRGGSGRPPTWAALCSAGVVLVVLAGTGGGLVWLSVQLASSIAGSLAPAERIPTLLGRSAITGASLVSLALVGWVAWGWTAWALVREIQARRRVPATHRPSGGSGRGVLGLAATGLLAMAPLLRGPGALSVLARQSSVASAPAQQPPLPAPRPVNTATRWYVVRPGDTLWSIAARQLGSPLRWPELVALNLGRPQPGGGELRDDHWIQPGWRLLLPPVAAPVPGAEGSTGERSVSQLVASRPVLAARHPRVAASPTVRTAPRPAEPAGNPAVVEEVLILGPLAAGVVLALDRARRARHRPGRSVLALDPPPAALADLEIGLRRGADRRPRRVAAQVIAATRRQQHHRHLGVEVPEVVAVVVGEHRAEVVVHPQQFPVPSPLRPTGVPGRAEVDLATLSSQSGFEDPEESDVAGSPMGSRSSLLVTLGRTGQGTVVVDLSLVGTLAVLGPEAGAALNAILLELAMVGPALGVFAVGFPGWVASVPGIQPCADLAEAEAALGAHRLANPTGAATVVVAPGVLSRKDGVGGEVGYRPDPPDALRGLLAAVVGDPVPWAQWCCRSGETGWVLEPRRTTVETPLAVSGTAEGEDVAGAAMTVAPVPMDHLQRVGEETSRGVAALLDLAARPRPESPRAAIFEGGQEGGPERGILVRVLGPVEVEGAERPFARRWALDLVVYLALHPLGASTEAWATALWPDRLMAPATLHSTASAARRALGQRADGGDHLPRSHGTLRLATTVRTDWAELEQAATSSDPEVWREGLALVRGRPLEGLAAVDWALLEGIQPAIEATVVEVAERYATWALEAGRPGEAEWAARQGLRACPYDERLYRVLLRAADQQGNPAGVEAVMLELVRLVADGAEPWEAVHPETWALYQQLSRRKVRLPQVG